ncbi:lamin tail domain-containing protein [Chitinophaga filiformis]|uniref:lamin tail domain-containing protein n=1 Tax=Chitinophaga filiformis TaxID=104663 RepID=UPI001F31C26C|nr:lamin tail domain-containing protein [Chitinophaga filiformis]MCF6401686.1 lamin tail domain-containing protein [Chitinophaga filiformis]
MRISIVCACLLLQASFSFAQVSEQFDYQSINEAISWKGSDTAWRIENGRLKSHLQRQSSSFHIATSSSLARNAIWEWWLQLDFNTSSLNYVDVFLTADSANLQGTGLKGYFVRIGNTKDEVSLYRKDGNTAPVLLIDGRDGITNHTSTKLKIRVVRKDDDWELWTDEKADGTAFIREGTATDHMYNTSWFMGFIVRQSTASFFGRHYFDNVVVTPIVADTTPPVLNSYHLRDSRTITLCFSEAPDSATLSQPEHFRLSVPGNTPDSIWQDSSQPACLHIQFRDVFPNGDSCRLSIDGVRDPSGNVMEPATVTFLYYTSRGYDVLIHEFLPRALPSAGLLPARFVELKNNSSYALQLKDWRIGNSNREVPLPQYLLPPGGLLVVCDKGSTDLFPADIPIMGISSFPAPGDSDIITLRNDSGILVHAVAYDRSWYGNPIKERGGWSLEMTDTNWPCAGSSNWKPSTAPAGGTPGRPNTVAGTGTKPPPVSLVKAFPRDTMILRLSFNGIMDSLEVTEHLYYAFSPSLQVAAITADPPLYNNISVHLTTPLLKDTVYTVAVSGIKDCTGQEVTTDGDIAFARVSTADTFDIVINEILYDPASGVPEFVEIYNRSRKAVDLSRLYLARRKEDGQLDDPVALGEQSLLLLSGGYAAFTTAPQSLCTYYDCLEATAIHKINLPALINGEGTVVLLNEGGQILDELYYSDKMHVALADNTRGVSLERLLPDSPTQDKYNWHSAAATVKYATPGYRNSQQVPVAEVQGDLTVQPAVFSPDNDGLEDLVMVRYNFPGPGYIINVTIFDAEGRPVRYLERNTLLPASGYMTWDGRGESNRELVSGIYIIFAEAFNAEGKVRHWKLPIVLGKR